MSRRFTKIICAILAAVVALGILLVAGCSENGHTDTALSGGSIFTGDVKSNGGFAVEKGNYIYFINGVQSNSANNDYGTPVKGAISRIHKDDYAARNYSKTDIVVPQIAYTTNYQAGIFIYGDEIYYGTPSTSKNADGAVQYQNLEMQSTKLDRSRTTAPYITFDDASYVYRFVEVEGTVYLIYVATGETLYDETSGVKNIHSLNTKTGKNTLLAYNVDEVMFDAEDKTNERIYYTMYVKNYASGKNYGYNQIYTVTADATEENEYDTSNIVGWDKDEDHKDHYVNCGTLVFDGLGGKVDEKTPFNYKPEEKDLKNQRSYTYKLKTYVNNTLIFTRSNTNNSEQYLYTYKDGTIENEGCDPYTLNENKTVGIEDKELLKNGANADQYKYIFDDNGDIKAVLYAEGSNAGISINYLDGGKLNEDIKEVRGSKYFKIVKDVTATILFVDTESHFVYYSASASGANGYSVWRVDYSSDDVEDYATYKPEPDEYTPVQILDVDAITDWYLPEIIQDQLIYPTASSDMTLYTYIMVCDLRNEDGSAPMTNAELRDLKKLYDSIEDTIGEFADAEKYPTEKYQNIQNILRYGFYTADTTYIYEHQKKVNSLLDENADPAISDETVAAYFEFLNPTNENEWKEFYGHTKTVNGKTVYANYRSYYYTLLGKMSSSDKEKYNESLISTYLPVYTEDTTTWWESIGQVGRVFFVIGMCCIGVSVIASLTILIIFLVTRTKRSGNVPKRRRIRVDTTDDKSIDVYNN